MARKRSASSTKATAPVSWPPQWEYWLSSLLWVQSVKILDWREMTTLYFSYFNWRIFLWTSGEWTPQETIRPGWFGIFRFCCLTETWSHWVTTGFHCRSLLIIISHHLQPPCKSVESKPRACGSLRSGQCRVRDCLQFLFHFYLGELVYVVSVWASFRW